MANFQQTEAAAKSLTIILKELAVTAKSLATSSKQLATSENELTKQKKSNATATQQLTALEKERIRIANQTKKVFAQNLAVQEKSNRTLILGQVRLTEARRLAREEARRSLGIASQTTTAANKQVSAFKSLGKQVLSGAAAFISFRLAFKVLKDSFSTIVDFEKGMSKVKAVTGATDEEFGKLTASALKLGASTSKTATEVSSLQLEFSKLGFSTAEVLAATKDTISLSIAAGADLAQSAKVVGSTIRGFGLSATETQRVVDVMAESFASSALDINKYETAMATVAPVARAVGLSLEETTAQMSSLADSGLDASTVGTSLRNIYLTLGEKGLTYNEALEKINNSQDKSNTALQLFGKRGATAALVLAENIEKTDTLTQSYVDAEDAARKMAETMEDNLAGDIDKMKSAWEGMILSLNEGDGVISKVGRNLVQFGTKALGPITKAFKGLTASLQDQATEAFQEWTDATLKDSTAQDVRNRLLTKRLEFEEKLKEAQDQLVGSSDREARQLEKSIAEQRRYIEAIDASIESVDLKLKADQDAIDFATKAAEQEANARRLAGIEEAKETSKTRLEIQIRASEKRAEFLSNARDTEAENTIKFLAAENQAFEDSIDIESEAFLASLEDKGEISIEALEKRLQEEADIQFAADQKAIKQAAVTDAAIAASKEAAFDAAETIVSDRVTAGIDARLDSTLNGLDIEQAMLDNKLDKDLITESEYATQSAAIDLEYRQEEAKAEKKQAVFDIALSTLVEVAKAGFITPSAVAIGIAGLAAGVAAAAKPLPAFFTGVNNFEGGYATVGEKGEEIINTPDGAFLSPSTATVMNLPKGTDVIPNEKSKEILSGEAKTDNSDILKLLSSIDKKSGSKGSDTIVYTPETITRINAKNTKRDKYINNYMKR